MLAAAIISVLAAVAVPAFSNNEFTEFAGGAITQKNEIKLENGKVIKTCRTAALPLMLEKSDKRTSTNQNTWLADVFRKYGHDEMLLPQLFCSDNYASNVKFINKKGDGRAGSFVALYNTNKYFETVDSEKEKISLPCDLLVYEYEGFSDENDKLVLCNENYPVVEFEKYYADGTPVYFMRISESEDGFIRFIAVYTDGRYVYSIQSRCENKKNITEEKQEMFIEMIRSIK